MSQRYENVYILNTSSVVGKKEFEGPLGKYFDYHIDDIYFNEQSPLLAERNLLNKSLEILFNKTNKDVDLIISGDLVNQIEASILAVKEFDIPFLGIYNACSNFTAGIIIASIFLESKLLNNIVVSTSSHNLMAERQFRMPNEYGANKPITTSKTTTSAGAIYLTNEKTNLRVITSTLGRIIDANILNPQDMGSIMAPSCYEVIKKHLSDLNLSVDYYDSYITGDLGKVGSLILLDLLKNDNLDITNKHFDCGRLIYNLEKGFIKGGSGSGCIAAVFNSYIYEMLKKNKVKRVLLIGCGALLNESSYKLGISIPGVASCVGIEVI